MEPAGVPALIAYRNGDKFADLVPLVDEVPFTCNVVTNLEMALQRYVVSPSSTDWAMSRHNTSEMLTAGTGKAY